LGVAYTCIEQDGDVNPQPTKS